MRIFITGALVALAVATTCAAKGSHSIRAHLKRDGTLVAATRATNPNRTRADNYSTKGNINPNSGRQGDRKP